MCSHYMRAESIFASIAVARRRAAWNSRTAKRALHPQKTVLLHLGRCHRGRALHRAWWALHPRPPSRVTAHIAFPWLPHRLFRCPVLFAPIRDGSDDSFNVSGLFVCLVGELESGTTACL